MNCQGKEKVDYCRFESMFRCLSLFTWTFFDNNKMTKESCSSLKDMTHVSLSLWAVTKGKNHSPKSSDMLLMK